jgi:hypothetical protein
MSVVSFLPPIVSTGLLAASAARNIRHTNAKIGTITLDASLTESHKFTNKLTQNPVENGSTVTDHVIGMPFKLSISGMVSNAKANILEAAPNALSALIGKTDSEKAREALVNLVNLLDLKKNNKLITVVTSLKSYNDMIITSLTFPRNNKIGDALLFNIELEQILVTESETTYRAAADTDKAGKRQNKGRKKTTTTPAEAKQSGTLIERDFKGSALKYISDRWIRG